MYLLVCIMYNIFHKQKTDKTPSFVYYLAHIMYIYNCMSVSGYMEIGTGRDRMPSWRPSQQSLCREDSSLSWETSSLAIILLTMVEILMSNF